MPTPTPGNGGGGGGGECADCPDNTNPVQCVQVPTNPTQVGIVDPNGCIIGMPTEPYIAPSFTMIVRSLPADVKILLNSNTPFYDGLQNYYNANQNLKGENFVRWAAQFSWENQDVNWTQFQNWFLEEPILNNTLQNELFEDWADPNRIKPTTRFKNHTKINGIYNQIKSAFNFKQYLQNFEPTFSVAHLVFDVGYVTNPAAIAQTREPQNYWIKITFNQDWDYPNTPKTVIAYTFMHEMIHAEIFRKLLSLASNPQGNINWNELMTLLNDHNYPGLFDYYTRYTTSDSDIDHHMMGSHYITIIVNFLKQVYGNTYTDTEYKTIAWSGLRGSKAWNLLPKTERDLYIKTWNDNYWLWEK